MILSLADQTLRRLPGKATTFAFWLLAALPLLLAAVLVATLLALTPAQAADEVSCSGQNVLTELKTRDPARYAAAVAEGDKTANGKGIFWKIEKPGLKPSWLMGTMHLTDPRVLTMPLAARTAHADADAIIVESDEILDDNKAAAALLAKPELTMFTDGTTITSLLSKEDAAKLEAGLKARGVALPLVARMRPWIISSFVSLPACEFARKAKGASFLDKQIAEQALAHGAKVVGLETLSEQLVAMSELPVEFHLQALIETLALGDRMNDVIETMIQLYLSGDVGMTMPMLKTLAPEAAAKDAVGYAAFEQRIILDRNHVMATRALPYLAKGNAFMAVGALHLSGDQGLVELLRQSGYKLTAVN